MKNARRNIYQNDSLKLINLVWQNGQIGVANIISSICSLIGDQ